MNELVWAIVVLLIGLILAIAEIFIPSAGLLVVLSAAAFIGSIILAFQAGVGTGIVFSIVVVVLVPTTIAVGLHYWPRTPIGRRVFLGKPTPQDYDPTDDHDIELRGLVGEIGRTITQLRPAGITEFAGRRIDTVAEGVVIDEGRLVRVVAVQGKRVVVRQLETDGQAT